MAKDFFRLMIDDLGDPMTTMASDNNASSDVGSGVFINTGSYILNAALSGSIYGGLPGNRVLVLAGETTVGKSFLAIAIAKHFLAQEPRGRVVFFDTESALTNDVLLSQGVDITRVSKSEPETLESFKATAAKLLDKYSALPEKDRFPMLLVLDSLSMLPSAKEVADTAEGKNVKDMTKAGVIRGIFRVLRLKMAKLQVPMIVTTHTYAVVGAYVPTKEMAGGGGTKYAADAIMFLSKTKERDGEKQVVGNVVTARLVKSRHTKEETKVHTRIAFDGGLDRYYGLLEYALAGGIVEKVGNKYKFPDGSTAFEKAIQKDPAKYWTEDVLKQLDVYLQKEFKYSSAPSDVVEDADESESEE